MHAGSVLREELGAVGAAVGRGLWSIPHCGVLGGGEDSWSPGSCRKLVLSLTRRMAEAQQGHSKSPIVSYLGE